MNLYDAAHRAADHLEQYPHLYYFYNGEIPDSDSGPRACMIAWVLYFAGHTGSCHSNAAAFGWENAHMILEKIGYYEWMVENPEVCSVRQPSAAVAFLRHFAERYRPASLPQSVRAIFDTQDAEHHLESA